MEPVGSDWAAVTASLNKMQDLIEVASHYERKLQRTADSVTRQKTAYDQIDRILRSFEE